MIPKFDKRGYLPPGRPYMASWAEFEARFGSSSQRKRLMAGLRAALMNLKKAGCQRAYVNGSFVTSKEEPGDWDACWELKGVKIELVDPVIIDADFFPDRMKQKYLGDLFVHAPRIPGGSFVARFQRDRDGQRKGIIVLNLETLL